MLSRLVFARVDWKALFSTASMALDDQDIGPWLLAALTLVLDSRGGGLAVDEQSVAVLADGPLDIGAGADDRLKSDGAEVGEEFA